MVLNINKFIIFLISNVPEVMATIYSSVTKMHYHNLSIYSFAWNINNVLVIEALAMTFAPAICADLLGMVLSFCVTYLIVIMQFTHVY
ncbi:Gustatory receptor 14 [Operophtera brumata]|uniref:Gustatory receptor 14 n=1 Tax=Operophtera brumata TaxID=104452 RepID=A0A0L7LB54_OPEBR|nr:Gustatory receptor 14 [Operophtera brumata]